MKSLVICVMLLAAVASNSQESTDPAFDRLAKVNRFAFGGIGIAGTTSQGEKDYKLILSRPTALADFERLFSVGSGEARCYALVGIRELDLDRFKELSRYLYDSKEKVVTQAGCVQGRELLSTVLKQIEAGQYSKR
jgi:hypothetical protein